MALARLAYANLISASGVVVTSNSEATGYSDDYAVSKARYKKWRSATWTGDQWIKFDLGSSQSFRMFAAVNAKVHSGGGTLRFQANATDSWGAPTVNQLVTVPSPDYNKIWTAWLGASQNLRWIRFYFTNVGAANDYVELAVAWCGPYFEPTGGVERVIEPKRRDPSPQRYAMGGQRSAVVRAKRHVVSGRFPITNATDVDSYRTFFDTVGAAEPFVLALDADDADLIWYGVFDSELRLSHFARNAVYLLPFTFAEDVA